MGKKIRVWDGAAWQDVAPSLPYTAIHSAQASMPLTGVDGQVWLDTDGTLAGQDFVPLSGGTMTGNLDTPSINSGPIVGRNKIINGDMGIWQRGTSGFSNGGFTADRMLSDNGAVVSRSTDAPDGLTYSMKYTSPGSVNCVIRHGIELPAAGSKGIFTDGSTYTFSIYAKSSVAGKNLVLYIVFADGSNGTMRKMVVQNTLIGTLTTSWARYTCTFTISSGSISSAVCLQVTPYVVAPNSDIYMTGMQLEAGNQATPFHTATPNQQTELAACQRYYSRWTAANGGSAYAFIHPVWAYSTTQAFGLYTYPVPMRTTPSLETTGTASNYRVVVGNSFIACSGVPSLDQANPYTMNIQYPVASGLTVGQAGVCGPNNNNIAYLGFSAEL